MGMSLSRKCLYMRRNFSFICPMYFFRKFMITLFNPVHCLFVFSMFVCLLVCLFLCLFVCLRFYVPLKDFSLIWRRHHYRWRVRNSDLCSALMAINQWVFFNVPHLLWHRPTLDNGYPRGPVTYCRAFRSCAISNYFKDLQCRSVSTWIEPRSHVDPVYPNVNVDWNLMSIQSLYKGDLIQLRVL